MAEGLVGGEGFAVDASLIAADANKQRSFASTDEVDWQELAVARRSVREYLDTLDDAAWGAASEVVPKFISPSDPAAQWTGAHKGHAFFAYADNYLIDLKAAIIVDVEATRVSRPAEVGAAKTMLDRTQARFGLKPQRLSADKAYGSAEILAWMVEEKNIAPHVPVWDKTQRSDDTLSSSDFQWDEQRNEYRCPEGHALRSNWRPFKNARTHITKADSIIYRSSKFDCADCPMKARCCPSTPIRKIARSIHEPARDVARAVARTRLYKQSRKDRKKVEMLFAHLKRIMKLDRLRLRGPSGAHDEFLLAATAQNLRRMAKRLCPSPSRPAFGAA